MRLLVLGGTAWLGREVVDSALRAGHVVVCVARGADVPVGARLVCADRDDPHALDAVARSPWDAVIDVARQPGHVRRAVARLEPVADRYVFVSTASVYASQATIAADEDAELLAPLDGDRMGSPEDYGPAKVACEDAVLGAFGRQRSVIARAGLIGGPGDPSGRTTYWPWRFAHPAVPDGRVLAPEAPELPTALIDVRDLAAWLVRRARGGTGGIVNATGLPRPLPDHLETARRVAGHRGPLVAASGSWLTRHGVGEWAGPRSLPLWLNDRDWYGMNARSNARALAAGLVLRPLSETLADALAALGGAAPKGAGLTDDEERELLGLLAQVGSS